MGEGGIIGKLNPSTTTSASGMWSLNEVFLRNTVSGEWPNFNAPSSVSYFMIGGGGGGNNASYGGAGSGQVPLQSTFAPTVGNTYTVTVGAGGAGGSGVTGTAGGTSSISSVATADGGETPGVGGGGTEDRWGADNNSYSGSQNGSLSGGGGAGAGGNGANNGNYTTGKNGGPGVSISIFPTSLTAGGGGGGKGYSGYTDGTASDGGGVPTSNSAAANRGGGGGTRFPGGSGRVVLRYASSFPTPASITGNPTITVSGGYRHYDFTSSGSITF